MFSTTPLQLLTPTNYLSAEEVECLDLRGALPHGGDANISVVELRVVVLDVPVPAVDLDAQVGRLLSRLRQKALFCVA
jgi:hypothetical protein